MRILCNDCGNIPSLREDCCRCNGRGLEAGSSGPSRYPFSVDLTGKGEYSPIPSHGVGSLWAEDV